MRCQFIKPDGNQCEANAMENSQYCFTHNPETSEEKKLAVIKGGLSPKRNTLNLPPVEIKSVQDVVRLLEDTINRVRSGEMPTNTANCIGYLGGHIIKALETSEIEKRLEKLEQIIFKK